MIVMMMMVPDTSSLSSEIGARSASDRPSLLLLGGGGHAAVVADAARAAGWSLAGYVDDRRPRDSDDRLPGLNYLGQMEDVTTIFTTMETPIALHPAVGDNELRQRWLDRFADFALAPPIVHPSAVVSPDAHLEDGCFIGPRAVVNPRARVRTATIINTAAVVEHDCVVGEYCHVAPGAILCGNVHIGARTLIGAGAVILPSRSIGRACTVAAGAVVIEDLPDHATAIGVPARITSSAVS